jgi:hypothetical protein
MFCGRSLRTASGSLESGRLEQPFRRGFQYQVRKGFITHCPCESQRTSHSSKGGNRVLVAARRVIPVHHLSQEFERVLELLGESLTNTLGLSGDLAAKGRDDTALTDSVPMGS